MIEIDINSKTPIFQQIVENVEKLVLTGKLNEGDFIPSVRELAVSLKVNPNTVAKAYQTLQQKGHVKSMRGRGLVVLATDEEESLRRKEEILDQKIEEAIKLAQSLDSTKENFIHKIKSLWED